MVLFTYSNLELNTSDTNATSSTFIYSEVVTVPKTSGVKQF